LGFRHAFRIIETTASTATSAQIIIIYVTRGLLSSLEEGKTVLETISKGHKKVARQILINTCAVIDGNLNPVTLVLN
jgi:hypothetical protein